VNNHSKREIALGTVLGGLAGMNAGGIYNDARAASEVNKRLSIKDLDKRIKGQWKAKLTGAVIGAGLVGGSQLLMRKNKKDKDGRSDKGKKRK